MQKVEKKETSLRLRINYAAEKRKLIFFLEFC